MARNHRKVIFYHKHFSDGGVERTNINHAKILLNKGILVEFWSLSFSYHYKDDLENWGIKVVRLNGRNNIEVAWAIFKKLYVLPRFEREKLVFVSCLTYLGIINSILFRLPNLKSISHVIAVRNHPSEYQLERYWKNRVVLFSLDYLSSRDKILTNSDASAEFFVHKGFKAKSIYNPTITEKLKAFSTSVKPSQQHQYIWVGRLHSQKDISSGLRLFREISILDPNAVLWVFGDGDSVEINKFNSLVEQLSLKGSVHRRPWEKDLGEIYGGKKTLILSSKFEGMPNVLIEALFFGLNFIALPFESGPIEILEKFGGGVICPTREISDSHQSIKNLLVSNYPPLNREYFISEFSITELNHKISKFYCEE